MKKFIFVGIAVIIIAVLIILASFNKTERSSTNYRSSTSTMGQISNMKLLSSAFNHNQLIPAKYTCDSENISPPLTISEVPEGAKSLLLIMDDPDVPKSIRPDGVWDHWLVWNIPAETKEIPEGKEPGGVIGKNTGGKFGYQGPCPPDREHRYFFKLYALDIQLDLPAESTIKKELEGAMQGHILGQTELMGRYNRQ